MAAAPLPDDSAAVKLDHVTIVTHDLERARRFFTEVVGLREGERPPFGVAGHWLYDDDRRAVHLVDATEPASAERRAPRIDHLAYRVPDAQAWAGLTMRLERHGLRYGVARVPPSGAMQLFVSLGPGVTVEFLLDPSPGRGHLPGAGLLRNG